MMSKKLYLGAGLVAALTAFSVTACTERDETDIRNAPTDTRGGATQVDPNRTGDTGNNTGSPEQSEQRR